MGYKGVDTTEAVFENHRISAEQILGGEAGKGFYQMMDGVEVGRVNVAARACGIANRAFELGVAYSQQRETFGKPDQRAPGDPVPASRRWRPRSRPRTR